MMQDARQSGKIAAAAAGAEIPEEVQPRGRALVMFGILLLSYAVNAMDRQLFPLLAPDVRREYGFSLAESGFLSTVFTLGMALAGLPTGYMLARFTRKATVEIGIAIFSAGTILTVYASGFADMLLYRSATGIGEAMQLTALLAIATSYFAGARGAAAGSINFTYGIGAMAGPVAAAMLLNAWKSWRAPMVLFGVVGFVALAAAALAVRPWLTEIASPGISRGRGAGAATLWNRNSLILTMMSVIGGMIIYGYLGMYPTYLREHLGYSAGVAGTVMSTYGIGALASVGGGWLGDRYSPRRVMGAAFAAAALLGGLLFGGFAAVGTQGALSLAWGIVVSGTLYVNLAGYHVKAVRRDLSGSASGIFVTSLYGSAALSGYSIGWLAERADWRMAGLLQISLLSAIGALLAAFLKPEADGNSLGRTAGEGI